MIPIKQISSDEFKNNLFTSKSTENIILDSTRAQIQGVDSDKIYIITQVACNLLNLQYKQGLCRIAALCLHMNQNNIDQSINIFIYLLQQFKNLWIDDNKFSYQWCDEQTQKYKPKQISQSARIIIFPKLISLWTQQEAWSVQQREIYLQFLMIFGTDLHYEYTEYMYKQQLQLNDEPKISIQQYLQLKQ